jgi:hypothetical protein
MRMATGTGSGGLRLLLFLVVCWALARACVHLAATLTPAQPPGPVPLRPALRAAVPRELGSAAMIVSMAAMVAGW